MGRPRTPRMTVIGSYQKPFFAPHDSYWQLQKFFCLHPTRWLLAVTKKSLHPTRQLLAVTKKSDSYWQLQKNLTVIGSYKRIFFGSYNFGGI